MSRILTVDDSRAVRTIIAKTLRSSFEILEAEDGEKGLGVLSEETVDIVLLDVTMPVMDGPEMLKQLRERGDKTPVILLTAESKTSLIGAMMQLGINDYILKPFKPEELMAKITKVLGPQVAEPGPAAQTFSGPTPAAGKPFVDVLMIDDMDNVAKKFRSMMPKHIKVNNVMDGQSALAACRERIFRTIVVDMVIPDVNSSALTSQLRVLQPTAAFIALYMRNYENPGKDARDSGFDGFLTKPFDPAQVNDFLSQYYDAQDLLSLEDNVMSLAAFPESKDRRAHYVGRIMSLSTEAIEKCASACYEDVIMDLSSSPQQSE